MTMRNVVRRIEEGVCETAEKKRQEVEGGNGKAGLACQNGTGAGEDNRGWGQYAYGVQVPAHPKALEQELPLKLKGGGTCHRYLATLDEPVGHGSREAWMESNLNNPRLPDGAMGAPSNLRPQQTTTDVLGQRVDILISLEGTEATRY